jgi:hypothetical protein
MDCLPYFIPMIEKYDIIIVGNGVDIRLLAKQNTLNITVKRAKQPILC